MTEKPDITDAQWVRALARSRGLDRAYALFPDAVEAAVTRGTTSLSSLPENISPLTEPASGFDPARFGEPR